MENFYFNLPPINIEFCSLDTYQMKFMPRVEDLLTRRNWKVYFAKEKLKKELRTLRGQTAFEDLDFESEDEFENFGFRTNNKPTRDKDLKPFADDMFELVYNKRGNTPIQHKN